MSTEFCQTHEDVIAALQALPDVLSGADIRNLRRQLRDLELQHPRLGNYWSWIFVQHVDRSRSISDLIDELNEEK